eukprot:365205-Chlamydomonas_euryale.AAC.16
MVQPGCMTACSCSLVLHASLDQWMRDCESMAERVDLAVITSGPTSWRVSTLATCCYARLQLGVARRLQRPADCVHAACAAIRRNRSSSPRLRTG